VTKGLRGRPEAPWALWSGIVGALAVAALSVKSIQASASSLAAFGYVYLPLVAALAAIPIALWGAALGHAVLRLRGAVESPRVVFIAVLVVAAALPAAVLYELQRGLRLEAAVRAVSGMDVVELDRALDVSPFQADRYYLAALAQHPQARASLLGRIAARDDPELYEPLGSLWDVMGANRHGLAVMQLVARHPNTDGTTLARLAAAPEAPRIVQQLAANPRTPLSVLERWYASTDAGAEAGLALNPKTPQRVLERLAASAHAPTRINLTANVATPREILDRLAADGDDRVARASRLAIEKRRNLRSGSATRCA
jgi:hypothetical protein